MASRDHTEPKPTAFTETDSGEPEMNAISKPEAFVACDADIEARPTDPVIALVAKWRVAKGKMDRAGEVASEFNETHGVQSHALEAAFEDRLADANDIGRVIAATPATTASGLCALVLYLLDDHSDVLESGLGKFALIAETLRVSVDAVERGA